MRDFTFCRLLSVALILFSLQTYSQDVQRPGEWDIPWIAIGDSLDYLPKQMVTITGKVIQNDTREPVSNASISAETFKYFDYTDRDGNFFLELPSGKYRIIVRHVGMKPIYLKLMIFSSSVYNVEMEQGSTNLDEVIISSRPIDANVRQTLAGLTKLSVTEIKTLPTLMGEVDILKSLQLMPGVSSVGEGSAGFNVRGGRTDQNLVLLNDVPLFNTSHALGFVSAFNQDILKDFTLYKGNVPSNFGGRASSVLDISTRRGDFLKWKYQGGIGPISSRLLAEGPIKKDKTSLIVAGRLSHANWALKKASDPDVKKSEVAFYDAFVGLSHKLSPTSIADVTFYGSKDDFQFSDQFGYSWNNYIIGGKLQTHTNRKASPTFSVAYGHFESSQIGDPTSVNASKLTNTMKYINGTEKVNISLNEQHDIVLGIAGTAYIPEAEIFKGYGNTTIATRSAAKNNGAEFAIFGNDDYQITDNFSLSVGLRYSFYSHLGRDTVYTYRAGTARTTENIEDTLYYGKLKTIKSFSGLEPRIAARISLSQGQSIKLSYNRMRQYIHLISNTASPTPIDLWQVSNAYLPPQIADNYSIGYFLNLKDNEWETSAEFFYKDMQNLVEYKDFPTLYLNKHLETELLSGKGRAYGGEVYVRRMKGKWKGWLSYTYSMTEVQVPAKGGNESVNGGKWYPSGYNKPHAFNLVIDRRLIGNGAFSVIFSYNTGRPLTAIESSYIAGGTVIPIYSERNKYRIPDYVRLDFSFTIGNVVKKIEDSLVFSLYNVFGKDNAYSVFYQRPSNSYFIPKPYKLSVLGAALPSLTYNFKF